MDKQIPEDIRQASDLISAVLRRIKDKTLDKVHNERFNIVMRKEQYDGQTKNHKPADFGMGKRVLC